MERPNRKDYDFNDVFEAVRFASNMIKYADYLENKQLPIHVVSGSALTAVRMIRDAVEYAKLKAWDSEIGDKKAQEIADEFHSGKYKRKDGMWVQVNWAVEKFEEHYR